MAISKSRAATIERAYANRIINTSRKGRNSEELNFETSLRKKLLSLVGAPADKKPEVITTFSMSSNKSR